MLIVRGGLRRVLGKTSMAMSVVLAGLLASVLAIPVWAGETRPPAAGEFDIEQPFNDVMGKRMLRSLLERAMDAVEDHFEIRGRLSKGEDGAEREGRFELRVYPDGKSHSNDHVGAEGWFRFSPEAGHELNLRLKSFKEPPQRTSQNPADFL